MSDPDLDELAAELSEFAAPEKKSGRPPREERVIAGFEEVQRFVEKHGRAPEHGEDSDIFERLYAVRLDRLRAEGEITDGDIILTFADGTSAPLDIKQLRSSVAGRRAQSGIDSSAATASTEPYG